MSAVGLSVKTLSLSVGLSLLYFEITSTEEALKMTFGSLERMRPLYSDLMNEAGCDWFDALQTLTVSPKAAHFLILQPEDVLQPISFVEVGETGQSTNQDCSQRAEEPESVNTCREK